MNCQEFRLMLDDYIDGVLSGEDAARMLSHAQTCEACREELRAADQIRDDLAAMNREIDVPLAAQAAWRSAVRRESRRRQMQRIVRVGASFAAAFAVLFGAYILMENKPMPTDLPAMTEYTATAGEAEQTPSEKAAGEDAAASDAGIAVAYELDETVPAYDGEEAGEARTFSLSGAGARSSDVGVYTEIQSSVYCAVADYDGALTSLRTACEAVGGRVVGVEEFSGEGQRAATMVVVVPADALDGFVASAGAETGRHVTDISVDVAAYASRVELLKGSIAALEDSQDDSVETADTLARLRSELETAQSELTSLRKRTGMARVMVTVEELPPSPAATEFAEEEPENAEAEATEGLTESEASEVPAEPEATEIPAEPEVTEVPAEPEATEIPAEPEVTEVPAEPEATETSEEPAEADATAEPEPEATDETETVEAEETPAVPEA